MSPGPTRKQRERVGAQRSALAPRVAHLVAPHTLRLRSPAGDVLVPAENYYLTQEGLRPEVAEIAKIVLGRSPAAQRKLNEALTDAHAAHEMSFRVKDPETGAYDKIFKVPSSAAVVPLREAHFKKLVASTGPVLRALRAMLQTIYSKPGATAADLGIDHLPAEERERVLGAIQNSVYFEPRLVHPAMKDYPFLSVAGFDAPVDLAEQAPVFFEFNLGTPSGLSNNLQLLESLKSIDPKLYTSFASRLPPDTTFRDLRAAVESNALAWTGNPRGISVVIGPGVANGAHPDVASIAMFSGMPLVHPRDLYQDKHGDVRLNTGAGQHHPAVTGIYGRMEESCFLSDVRDGVPIRGPDYEDNPVVGARLKVALEPGLAYDFIYDAQDEIVGVRRDLNGEPKLMQFGESIGRDPARPEVEPGSFLEAIHARKLYYSGLGGRVVDDKRVFQAVSRHVAPGFRRSEDEPIARPPRTLDPSEYEEIYQSKHLENYVIKVPDKSGGEGVKLLCNLSPAERQQALADLRADPGAYIVQEFARPAVMTSVEEDARGNLAFGSLANDWRIFSMIDAAGNVAGGPHSLLLRAAKPFSASTNTSQGAGYGIGLVLSDAPVRADTKRSLLPQAEQEHVGLGTQQDLEEFLDLLHRLSVLAPSGTTLPVTALQLADAQRKVMHVLGRELAPLMSLARDFAAGLVDHATLSAEVRRYRALMLEHTYPAAGVADRIKARLVELVLPVAVPVLKKINREALRAKAPLEPFARPIRVREEELAGSKLEKWEVGRYLQAASPEMRQAMAELAAEGGELRRPVVQHEDGTVSPQTAAAYFRLDEQGRPIVGLDVGQDWALAGLEHEMTHFRLWRARRDELLAAGMDPAQAGRAAFAHWNEPLQRVAGERAALGAEMNVETRRSPFNQGAARPPRSPEDSGFVERMCYPELEGIREIFHRARWGDLPLDVDTATNLFDHVVRTAEALRREAFERRRALAAKLEKSPDVRVRSEGYLLREHAHRERAQPLFDLVASWMTRARFASDQTLAQFDDFLAAALIRAGLRGEAAELNRRSALVAQQ